MGHLSLRPPSRQTGTGFEEDMLIMRLTDANRVFVEISSSAGGFPIGKLDAARDMDDD